MKRICIAGGIGSGKSVVSRILRLRGEYVFDCDSEARHLMEDASGSVYASLRDRYGESLYRADGTLDRPRLSEIIFVDSAELAWCNALVHRSVGEAWIDRCRELEKRGMRSAYIESAIPAGSGLTQLVDEVWLIAVPEEMRVERSVKRGMDVADARRRVEAQRVEMKQLHHCGVKIVMIDNTDTASLLSEIDRALSVS